MANNEFNLMTEIFTNHFRSIIINKLILVLMQWRYQFSYRIIKVKVIIIIIKDVSL